MATFDTLIKGGVTVLREKAADTGSASSVVSGEGMKGLALAQAIVRGFIDRPGSMADELIADRRAENLKDEAETAAWESGRTELSEPE